MTVLPSHRVQCDRCLTTTALAGRRSDLWGEQLFDQGWVARPIRSRYQHACRQCAEQFIAEAEGRKFRKVASC